MLNAIYMEDNNEEEEEETKTNSKKINTTKYPYVYYADMNARNLSAKRANQSKSVPVSPATRGYNHYVTLADEFTYKAQKQFNSLNNYDFSRAKENKTHAAVESLADRFVKLSAARQKEEREKEKSRREDMARVASCGVTFSGCPRIKVPCSSPSLKSKPMTEENESQEQTRPKHKPTYVPSITEQHLMKIRSQRQEEHKSKTAQFKYTYVPGCLEQHAQRLKQQRDLDIMSRTSSQKHNCLFSRSEHEATKIYQRQREELQKQNDTLKFNASFNATEITERKIASLPGYSKQTKERRFRTDFPNPLSFPTYNDMIHLQMRERSLRLRELEKKTKEDMANISSTIKRHDVFVAEQKEIQLKERQIFNEVKSSTMIHSALTSPVDDFLIQASKEVARQKEQRAKLLNEDYARTNYLASAQWTAQDFGFRDSELDDATALKSPQEKPPEDQ